MNHYFPVTHSILSVKALETDILSKYALGTIVDFKFLRQGLNDTYILTIANGEKFILRVYRTNWRSLPDISYEIDVLNHISKKGVSVSKPLSQKDGSIIQSIPAPEGTRYIVLFTYAVGELPLYEEVSRNNAFNYGKAAAKIHNAAQDFKSQHIRFSIDIKHLIDIPMKSIGSILSHRQDDWLYLQHLVDKIHSQFDRMSSTLEQGFCHGDLHGGNANIADDGTITFYDFDCCGWGWRAYDIAVFRWSARLRNKENSRWKSFLKGYTEERTISDADLEAVPLFIGVRHLWLLGLHISNGGDTGFGWLNDAYIDRGLKFLHDWDKEYFSKKQLSSSILRQWLTKKCSLM